VGQGSPGGIGRYEITLRHALDQLSHDGSLRYRWLTNLAYPPYLAETLDNAPPWTATGDRHALARRMLRDTWHGRPHLILFTHVNLAPLGLLARLASPRTRYLVSAHGAEVWRPLSPVKRLALQQSKRILPVSSFTAEQLQRVQSVPPERLALLPNALEGVPEWGAVAGLNPTPLGNAPMLLTVGRMDVREGGKGVDTVLQALPQIARLHPCLRYVVAGEGDDIQRLRALAEALGVHDNVEFLGRVDATTLSHLYQECFAFVMPSNQEGFGIVYLEAMAAGKPVIAAYPGGATDVVDHERTGLLVRYGNVGDVATAVLTLVADPDLAKGYGRAGYEKVVRQFTVDAVAPRLRHILLDSAGRRD